MKRHMENTRAALGDLAGLAHKTEAAERRILRIAQLRMSIVEGRINDSRPGIEAASKDAQDAYLDLITERGHLTLVIARSKKALAAK